VTAVVPGALADWSADVLARTEACLDGLLPVAGGGDPLSRLHEAMRYAVLGGGKRVPTADSPTPPAN